jgi:hypothetical protein
MLDPFTRHEAAVGFGGLELPTAALLGQKGSISSSSAAETAAGSAAAAGLLDAPEALRIIQVRGLNCEDLESNMRTTDHS